MKIIPNTMLKIDPEKPAFEAGKVCDVKNEIAENLLDRGLAKLPVDESAVEDAADTETGDAG